LDPDQATAKTDDEGGGRGDDNEAVRDVDEVEDDDVDGLRDCWDGDSLPDLRAMRMKRCGDEEKEEREGEKERSTAATVTVTATTSAGKRAIGHATPRGTGPERGSEGDGRPGVKRAKLVRTVRPTSI
jgi:hypothetical protein